MTTEVLPEPLLRVACGRIAQYIINGTSWCRVHQHPRG